MFDFDYCNCGVAELSQLKKFRQKLSCDVFDDFGDEISEGFDLLPTRRWLTSTVLRYVGAHLQQRFQRVSQIETFGHGAL